MSSTTSTKENITVIEPADEKPPNQQPSLNNGTEDQTKQNGGNFSRAFGNMLRRSKRLMSGRRRSQDPNVIHENQTLKSTTANQNTSNISHDKENKEPVNHATKTNGTSDFVNGHDSVDAVREEQQSFEEPDSPGGRRPSQTFYGSEKQVLRDGRKIKEIEVTGERPDESNTDMKKQKKLQRRKSIDKEELNVSCRALGKADHEGWMFKKAGGHGIVPVSWKKYWVVIKLGKMYCYKTSFNMQADYLFMVNDYSVDNATEKKKNFAFLLKPNEEDKKGVIFACETEQECNDWIETINKILSGVDLNNEEDEETTGLPAGFGTRTSSMSQPRVRKMSAGTGAPSSVLSVGSMFHKLEEKPKEDQDEEDDEDVELKDLLYKEVEVETEAPAKSPSPKPTPIPVVEPVAKQVIQTKERENEKTASIDAETIIKEMEEKTKENEEPTPEPALVVAPVSVEPEPVKKLEPVVLPVSVEPEPVETPEPVEESKAPVAEPEASSDETEEAIEVAKKLESPAQSDAPAVESPTQPESPTEPEPVEAKVPVIDEAAPEPPKAEPVVEIQSEEEKLPEQEPLEVQGKEEVVCEVRSPVTEDVQLVPVEESVSIVPTAEESEQPESSDAPVEESNDVESPTASVEEESKIVEPAQPEASEIVEITTTEVVVVESNETKSAVNTDDAPVAQSEVNLEDSPVIEKSAPVVDNSENVVIETKTENVNGDIVITETITTTTTSTVEVDDLDIPSLDSGNSSLMDDITFELATK
uniref:PH domain-containing protein n=1 Tax=Clytia hemisphaerica TaxID=252671 RepID=A0A7M5WV28_9CNID